MEKWKHLKHDPYDICIWKKKVLMGKAVKHAENKHIHLNGKYLLSTQKLSTSLPFVEKLKLNKSAF